MLGPGFQTPGLSFTRAHPSRPAPAATVEGPSWRLSGLRAEPRDPRRGRRTNARLAACKTLALLESSLSAVSVLGEASIKHARRSIAARSQRLGRRALVRCMSRVGCGDPRLGPHDGAVRRAVQDREERGARAHRRQERVGGPAQRRDLRTDVECGRRGRGGPRDRRRQVHR